MKRWSTISFVLITVSALLFMSARWLAPVMGFGSIENEWLYSMSRLMPFAAMAGTTSIVLLVLTFRWKPKPVYPDAKRLVEEAEEWSDEFVIGEELESRIDFSSLTNQIDFRSQQIGNGVSARAGYQFSSQLSRPISVALPHVVEAGALDLAMTPDTHETEAIQKDDHDMNLATIETLPNLNGSQVISSALLNQLPPPLTEFAGRSFELAELMAARANPENRVLSLQGLGGVGKTTLALKLAHQMAAHYPDAQFFVDLKGASPQPLSVAEIRSHVIRAYMPAARLPENEAELGKLYGSVLNGKRALLLFDNAANTQQIASLVPPAGCLLLVTSRQHLSLTGMFASRLDTLPAAEAQELLRRLLPEVGNQAARLAELCGYLPLALRLAASALTQNHDLNVDEYARRLARWQNQEGRRAIDAVLRVSYEMLSPGLRKLWRTLAVFPGTFDLNAAAAVWKIHPDRAANAHAQLMAYSLVERNHATGRYRLHDLMTLFAESSLNGQERAIARHHHAAHYQSVLHETDALYEQGGEFLTQGLELVDLEWLNVQTAQTWAATKFESNQMACDLCNSFPDAGKYVLSLRQHPRERIRWSEAALSASKKMKRRKSVSKHLIALGDSYSDLSEVHHALDCYQQALEIARETKNRRAEADAMIGLGTAYCMGGDLARAREYHEFALRIAQELEDNRAEANALGALGMTLYALRDARQATDLLERQLHLARELGDRRNESNALGGLGLTHYALGDARMAVDLFNEQFRITREIGDRRGEASALVNLGYTWSNLKEYERAIGSLQESLTVAREIGDRRSEVMALGGLGVAHYLIGNQVQAIDFLERQRMLASEIGDRRGETSALTNLGEAYVSAGETRRAIELLRQAFNIASRMDDPAGQAKALFNLALALEKLGDRVQAVEQAEKALELFQVTEHPLAETVRRQLVEWQ
ncbi:MAG: ATP-binding protein [Blastocatellia bacterium]